MGIVQGDFKKICSMMTPIVKDIKEKLLHYYWDLAFGIFSEKMLSEGLSTEDFHIVINPYKGKKWFADPFIYRVTNDTLELFVEEFDYSVGRGRIGHLVISKKNCTIEKLSIILEKDTHLSFPAIYRVGDEIIVHPENSHSGKSYMYKYDKVNDTLVAPICVCNDPISDAIIIHNGERYEMYATRNPNPNGNILIRYESECFIGPYEEKEQIVLNGNHARMAGAFLQTKDCRIRPSQDCNGAYGRAVLFMDGEKTVSELRPNGVKFAGIHTFNTFENVFVIDLKKYDYALLYYLKSSIKR